MKKAAKIVGSILLEVAAPGSAKKIICAYFTPMTTTK
jgi:hypothetical protein